MLTLAKILPESSSLEPAIILPGEKPLIIEHGRLQQHIGAFQAKLAALGIGSKARVGICLPNSLEFVVTFFAVTWQQGIAAPLNPAYKEEEIDFYLRDLESVAVIVPEGAYQQDSAAVRSAKKIKAAIAECRWDGSTIVLDVKDNGRLQGQSNRPHESPCEGDTALILHTSGTTGRPKAVREAVPGILDDLTWSRYHLPTRISGFLQVISPTSRNKRPRQHPTDHIVGNICKTYNLTTTDRTMLVMPLFHIHGLVASFLAPLQAGSAIIIPPRLAPSFWQDFLAFDATWYSATPTMHMLILSFPAPADIRSIRFIRSCSSSLSPQTLSTLEARFKAPVLEAYAMTEASHQITSNPLPPADHKAGTVGLAQETEIRILGPQDSKVTQDGEGEICIRGPTVTSGYLNNPTANATSFTSEGFFRTGDYGKLEGEGYLTITGRIKEFINKGGEKISPVELDNVISAHPSVADVVVFAIEDDMYGQDVGAAVRLVDGSEIKIRELKKWIGGKVATHKIPKKVRPDLKMWN